jgi:hypothetical protein
MSAALIFPGKAVLDEEGNVIKSIYTKNPVYKESWEHQFGLPVEEHERRYTMCALISFLVLFMFVLHSFL